MKIDVLKIGRDGTQTLVPTEVPDDRFQTEPEDSQSVTLEGLAAEVETLKQDAEQAKLDRQALSILLTGEEATT